MRTAPFTTLLFSLAPLLWAATLYAATPQALVEDASWDVGISVADLETGASLLDERGTDLLKPASVLKVVTSAAVFTLLPPEDRFSTEILLSGEANSKTSKLYIRGSGDPSLAIEQLWLIARRVKLSGLSEVGTIVLDASSFQGGRAALGQRAYQTGSSALSFNFNSIGTMICPSGKKGGPALVDLDPWEGGFSVVNQAKTVPGAVRTVGVDERGGNSFLVSGKIGVNADCKLVYRSVSDPVRYLGTTFRKLLATLGITSRAVDYGETPASARLLFSHEGKEIKEIVGDLNHFSNNFVGEQLIFRLGDTLKGADRIAPGRFERPRGLRQLSTLLEKFGCKGCEVYDGSGLSHQNKLTAKVITDILVGMKHSESVGPEFVNSLSVGGRSGTLKDRDFGPVTVRGKTGTLDGVSSLAGYFSAKSGREIAFTILQNRIPSKDRAMVLEEKVVKALYAQF